MKKIYSPSSWKVWFLVLSSSFFFAGGLQAQYTQRSSCNNPYTYSYTSYASPYSYNLPRYDRNNNWRNAQQVRHGRSQYFYQGGLFYQRTSRGMYRVEPPMGIRIDKRPFRADKVKVRGFTYYNSGRYWFQKSTRGQFELVRNPFR